MAACMRKFSNYFKHLWKTHGTQRVLILFEIDVLILVCLKLMSLFEINLILKLTIDAIDVELV